MEGHLRDIWQKEYAHLARENEPQTKLIDYEAWRAGSKKQLVGKEFTQYCGDSEE